jgi:hypothetical protein
VSARREPSTAGACEVVPEFWVFLRHSLKIDFKNYPQNQEGYFQSN